MLFLFLRHDIGGGRSETDRVSAKTSSFGKAFETLCYTADGEAIIAGLKTKTTNICPFFAKKWFTEVQTYLRLFRVKKNWVADYSRTIQVKTFVYPCFFHTGGQTKNVCVYHVKEQMLMKKFPISKNLSFDAMEVLNKTIGVNLFYRTGHFICMNIKA